MALYAAIDRVNLTENFRCGWCEPSKTSYDSPGDLFRACQEEYGRCSGKMYIDRNGDGTVQHIGWCFVKREKYDDCNETYLCETWIVVYDNVEQVRSYAKLG